MTLPGLATAGATRGLMQVSLGNPNQLLDSQGMPGCVLHADLTAVVIGANPAYSLSLPNSLSFLGLPLHVQGGAFQRP